MRTHARDRAMAKMIGRSLVEILEQIGVVLEDPDDVGVVGTGGRGAMLMGVRAMTVDYPLRHR